MSKLKLDGFSCRGTLTKLTTDSSDSPIGGLTMTTVNRQDDGLRSEHSFVSNRVARIVGGSCDVAKLTPDEQANLLEIIVAQYKLYLKHMRFSPFKDVVAVESEHGSFIDAMLQERVSKICSDVHNPANSKEIFKLVLTDKSIFVLLKCNRGIHDSVAYNGKVLADRHELAMLLEQFPQIFVETIERLGEALDCVIKKTEYRLGELKKAQQRIADLESRLTSKTSVQVNGRVHYEFGTD